MSTGSNDSQPNGVPIRIVVGDEDYFAVTGRTPIDDADAILDDSGDSILDSFPSIIANRLKKMLPSGFCIAQIECGFEVAGKIGGTGVGGFGKVVFAPKSDGT